MARKAGLKQKYVTIRILEDLHTEVSIESAKVKQDIQKIVDVALRQYLKSPKRQRGVFG